MPSMSSFRCSGPSLSSRRHGGLASTRFVSQDASASLSKTHCLLNGSIVVEAMAYLHSQRRSSHKTTSRIHTLQEVDVVHLETLEAILDGVEDVLRWQACDQPKIRVATDGEERTLRLRPFWLMTPNSSGDWPVCQMLML